MALHNSFANGQSNPRAGIFILRVKPLEDHKNAMPLAWIDSDAIVLYQKLPLSTLFLNSDFQAAGLLRAEGGGDDQVFWP